MHIVHIRMFSTFPPCHNLCVRMCWLSDCCHSNSVFPSLLWPSAISFFFPSTCMHTCIHVCVHVCCIACTYVGTYVCVFVYECMYVCIIHTHTHTHTHKYPPRLTLDFKLRKVRSRRVAVCERAFMRTKHPRPRNAHSRKCARFPHTLWTSCPAPRS